jgi:hypothetical protein
VHALGLIDEAVHHDEQHAQPRQLVVHARVRLPAQCRRHDPGAEPPRSPITAESACSPSSSALCFYPS